MQKTDKDDFAGEYDKQVKIYTQGSRIAQNCNADTVYVYSIQKRENIGYYTDEEGLDEDFNAMTDYKAAYRVVLKSHNHFPIHIFLFCEEQSDKALMKYLEAISKSILFG